MYIYVATFFFTCVRSIIPLLLFSSPCVWLKLRFVTVKITGKWLSSTYFMIYVYKELYYVSVRFSVYTHSNNDQYYTIYLRCIHRQKKKERKIKKRTMKQGFRFSISHKTVLFLYRFVLFIVFCCELYEYKMFPQYTARK